MMVLMKIDRAEYLALKKKVSELETENYSLKKEIKTLKATAEKAVEKKKGDKKDA